MSENAGYQDAFAPERTPVGSSLYTWGTSSTGPDDFHCFCSCGFIETGWPQERLAAASLSAHLATNHGKARTVPT